MNKKEEINAWELIVSPREVYVYQGIAPTDEDAEYVTVVRRSLFDEKCAELKAVKEKLAEKEAGLYPYKGMWQDRGEEITRLKAQLEEANELLLKLFGNASRLKEDNWKVFKAFTAEEEIAYLKKHGLAEEGGKDQDNG